MASEHVQIRGWQASDEDALVRLANNRQIWRNLASSFPHPYTRDDAESWIQSCSADSADARNFAVVQRGELVGGAGYQRLGDLHSRSAEIGYWIGEAFWGRGIATEALRLASADAFQDFDFVRLQAGVLSWNPASCRVLEKVAFVREGTLRQHVFKDGEVCDLCLYAKLRSEI